VKDIDSEKKRQIELAQMDKMFTETRKVADIATFLYNVESKSFKHSLELDEFIGVENLVYLEQMRQVVHPDDLEQYDSTTEKIESNSEGLVNNYRIIKNGEIRYLQSSIFGEKDRVGNVTSVFGILKDITEIETRKKEIEFFANHDILTGLFNRNNFEERSEDLDNESGVCIFICDVDGLKLINDAFGHIEGDELLVYLADVLREAANGNSVYRIGGDEFVILIENADEKVALQYEKEIKDRIKSFRLFGVGFGASIGYDFIDSKKTFEDAFRNAENLMYRRKLTERKSRKSTALNTIMQTMHEKNRRNRRTLLPCWVSCSGIVKTYW
jgi:diguanylate cyclase (GGDEF)-like protein/PAS domain S-box-containing protein